MCIRDSHNTTILLIEHDMKLVMGISDRLYVVNQGTPLANGTPEQIRNNPDVIRACLLYTSQFAVILAAILLVVSRELMRDFNEYSMLMLGGFSA